MKLITLFYPFLLFLSAEIYCQNKIILSEPLKTITLLKNNTYEIKEFTEDSLLIYKGTLSSVDPEIRHGKFYFFDNKGKVIVTGIYKQDIPYGTWVYYNESMDTLKAIDYTAVWKYMELPSPDFYTDSITLASLNKKDKQTMNPDGTFYAVEKMPVFKNDESGEEFNKYIYDKLIYPIYAFRNRLGGEVVVQFVIDSQGKIRNPVITNPIISDLSIEALRAIFESPIWEPGYQKGLPVNVRYTWPISFLPWQKYTINPSALEKDEQSENELEEVFFIVEDMPKFNGGEPAIEFKNFITKNLHYPEKAVSDGISGVVVVQFIVNSNGKVVYAIVVKSADPELDKEAIRVVKSSPNWKPGKQRGKPVNVLYTFPIIFTLQ
jgi:TonB family protein